MLKGLLTGFHGAPDALDRRRSAGFSRRQLSGQTHLGVTEDYKKKTQTFIDGYATRAVSLRASCEATAYFTSAGADSIRAEVRMTSITETRADDGHRVHSFGRTGPGSKLGAVNA